MHRERLNVLHFRHECVSGETCNSARLVVQSSRMGNYPCGFSNLHIRKQFME